MAHLLDRPSGEQMKLLTLVALGGRGGNGRLPTRQWVMLQLQESGLDGDAILKGLPTWGPNRYLSVTDIGSEIDQVTGVRTPRLRLTFHGRHHVGDEESLSLNHVFRAALAAAEANQATLAGASPFDPITMALPAKNTAATVSVTSGYRCSVEELSNLFSLEPPTWNLNLDSNRDRWSTNGATLRPFRGLGSDEEYLAILEEVLISQNPVVPIDILPPMALPEAFDHLDLAWRLVMKSPLIGTKRLSRGAVLTQPVNSADEFDSRCSAVKDILDQMQVDRPQIKEAAQWKSISSMQYRLKALAPAETASIDKAIKTLRSVAALRDSQQHGGMVNAASEARTYLGLSRFSENWFHDWNAVKAETVQALRMLREILVSHL